MAEDQPDKALDKGVEEMRSGAKRLSKLDSHEDWDIPDSLIGTALTGHYHDFLVVFTRRFGEAGGKARWGVDRPRALRMAEYIGILARFHAEAQKSPSIRAEDLQWGVDKVKELCRLRLERKEVDVREIWCM